MRFGLARIGVTVGGFVLVAVVGGCTSDKEGATWNGASPAASGAAPAAGAESAPPFTEPASYGFTLTRGCNEASPLGRYKVTVRSGAVSATQRLDSSVQPSAPASSDVDLGPVTGQDGEEIEVPTLAELRDMAQTATDDGGEVTATYDTKDGHPVKVVINVSDEGPSGAECWAISDYAPAA